ncbi:helix-turn-helix domain-containing protein [Paenibacillus sp. HJGM_3]|uniref:helix-turn-helix domain-containing protein n=1 Tax=Paenibacillus sp. HJGM_3 TaxID=3379816 RepID=UPI00385CC57A
MNDYLHRFEKETESPLHGVLLASQFQRGYGYCGHRSAGTKDWLLIYTISGEGEFRVTKEVITCRAGDVVILSPGIPHHYASAKDSLWEIQWVHFVPLPEWNEWLHLPRTAEKLINLHVKDNQTRQRIQVAFQKLIYDSTHKEMMHHQLAMNALSEILILLYREHLIMYVPAVDERIDRVVKYIAEKLHEQHSLEQLSNQFGLSVSHLCHLYKEQLGETVMGSLLRMRLEKAAKLLELSGRQVKDISYEVGFESPYYFSRQFTSRYGMSPTAYREKVLRLPLCQNSCRTPHQEL